MQFRNRWSLLLIAPLAAILVVAAACGGGKSSADKTSTAAAGGGTTPAAGGTSSTGGRPSDAAPAAQQNFTTNIAAEPNTIDPQAESYTYESSVVHQLFISLFDQDPKTSELIPWGATAVPTTANGGISADGLTYTVKIKSGLKWSDGSPLTAKDFVYGILRGYNLNVSGSGYGGFISSIKGADAALKEDPKAADYVQKVNTDLAGGVILVDDQTIKLVANAKSASFLSNFTLPITAAVQQANVEAAGANYGVSSTAAQIVTSGPFKVKQWVAKDSITIVPNPNYTAEHEPYLQQVTFKFIADGNQAYNAYIAGQLDQSGQIPASQYPVVQRDANLKQQVKQEEEFGTRWISVDVTIPPWNNKNFVIAINQATDREAIARDVYFGLRKAWTAPCPQKVVGCDPSLFSNLEFNLSKAQTSIKNAYPNGNIPPVTLETVDDPTTKALVTTLQSQWQKIGVTTNIVTTDQKTLRADMKSHKSGTQITGWAMDYADPTDIFSIWTTAQVGGNNLGFYSRPQYDTLEQQQDATLEASARTPILKQMQQFLAADPPVIQFAIQLRTDLVKPNVKGLVSSPFDYQVYGDQQLVDVYIGK